MSITIDQHFNQLIDGLVKTGRFEDSNEVVHEGLRLLEEKEAIKTLKDSLDRADERGGSHTSVEVQDFIAVELAKNV